jgi:hypothetical protein
VLSAIFADRVEVHGVRICELRISFLPFPSPWYYYVRCVAPAQLYYPLKEVPADAIQRIENCIREASFLGSLATMRATHLT